MILSSDACTNTKWTSSSSVVYIWILFFIFIEVPLTHWKCFISVLWAYVEASACGTSVWYSSDPQTWCCLKPFSSRNKSACIVHSFIHYVSINKIAKWSQAFWLCFWNNMAFSADQKKSWTSWAHSGLYSLLSMRWQCWSAVEYKNILGFFYYYFL